MIHFEQKKFDLFLDGGIFIHCENQYEKEIILRMIERAGVRWVTGVKAFNEIGMSRNNFIIDEGKLYYSSLSVQSLDREVYYFKDVFSGNKFL